MDRGSITQSVPIYPGYRRPVVREVKLVSISSHFKSGKGLVLFKIITFKPKTSFGWEIVIMSPTNQAIGLKSTM